MLESLPVKADVLIIGAGFAGAATAYHLACAKQSSVIVVEKEEVPGFHASGRNASLVLQSVEHGEIREIVAQSQREYSERRSTVGYRPVGSLLLGDEQELRQLRQPDLVPTAFLDPGAVRERIHVLKGYQFESALLTMSDGIMDISQLLGFYLEGSRNAGHELHLNCEVSAIKRSGDHFNVQTNLGLIEAGVVVNAAGAWAPRIAGFAGLKTLPMQAFKRHLFILEGIKNLDPDWPFVWSVASNFYFRPESGGLLFSVCDEEPGSGEFIQIVNPDISIRLAELIAEELPALADALERRVWSCFRTKTPDGEFHLGWSEEQPEFFWIAGLGGHGMGASWELGRRAAEMLLAGPKRG